MPYRLADAPNWVPESQTLEVLLGKRNQSSPSTQKTKTLQELDDAERRQTGLVKLGKTTDKIQGDPFGIHYGWAGNVAHPTDERMVSFYYPVLDSCFPVINADQLIHQLRIMPEIFEKLNESTISATDEIDNIRRLLSAVEATNPAEIASQFAPTSFVRHPSGNNHDIIVTFQLGRHRVRLIQAWDLEVGGAAPTPGGFLSRSTGEPIMSIALQQYMMATLMNVWDPTVAQADAGAVFAYLQDLRHEAQYRYWFETDPDGRERLQHESSLPKDDKVQNCLDEILNCWPEAWTGGDQDPDHFSQRAKEDQMSASLGRPMELLDEDIILVTDRRGMLGFASFEGLAQLLFGSTTTNRLADCLDLWSFFTPLPAPEPWRRVIDRHSTLKMHPELDMSKATVDTLAQAKMATAHYGSCASTDGVHILKTRDSKFLGIPDSGNCVDMFPRFYQAAFGKAASLLYFLMTSLDQGPYMDGCCIFEGLPESRRLSVCNDNHDFLTKFSLGINTESSRDSDTAGAGFAGLVTLGQYQGGELCMPDLGFKVPCTPGTTAIVGGGLKYHTSDCSGQRFVMTGSNEESCKRYAYASYEASQKGSKGFAEQAKTSPRS
ncbi:hypothetical protein PG988_013570 [Apiospora saccharicola]